MSSLMDLIITTGSQKVSYHSLYLHSLSTLKEIEKASIDLDALFAEMDARMKRVNACYGTENASTILPRLLLADQDYADDEQSLIRDGVTTVVSFRDPEEILKAHLDIKYHRKWIRDEPHCKILFLHRQDTFDIIDSVVDMPTDDKILIHCAAGISRSATIAIAYVMRSLGMTYTQALRFVQKRRPVVDPNEGFREQLQEYEKDLLSVWPNEREEIIQVLADALDQTIAWLVLKYFGKWHGV